jgi:hypothetical protein
MTGPASTSVTTNARVSASVAVRGIGSSYLMKTAA